MPLALQTRLLRVLEERQVVPIGGEPQAVDVRIVSATHRDLLERVEQGSFREDLYYRLNGLEVALPAVRERSDKAQLLDFLLRQEAQGEPIDIEPRARQALLDFAWPGNVRQMRNVLRTLVALCEDSRIVFPDLPAIVRNSTVPVGAALCRERAAERPQGPSRADQFAGAAAQPDRDTRPLLQGPCKTALKPGLRGRGQYPATQPYRPARSSTTRSSGHRPRPCRHSPASVPRPP